MSWRRRRIGRETTIIYFNALQSRRTYNYCAWKNEPGAAEIRLEFRRHYIALPLRYYNAVDSDRAKFHNANAHRNSPPLPSRRDRVPLPASARGAGSMYCLRSDDKYLHVWRTAKPRFVTANIGREPTRFLSGKRVNIETNNNNNNNKNPCPIVSFSRIYRKIARAAVYVFSRTVTCTT
jgi:hypothetical protein